MVESPYPDDNSAYNAFDTAKAYTCTSKQDVKVKCTVYNTETIDIVFTEVSDAAKALQTLTIEIPLVNTPFSSQILSSISVRIFKDRTCSSQITTKQLPNLTIKVAELPAANVLLTTTDTSVASSKSSNQLIVKFTPSKTLSRTGSGRIDIGVPDWWKIGQTAGEMYNAALTNKCYCDSMTITYSKLNNGFIEIHYQDMIKQYWTDTPLEIKCKGFRNPIVPKVTGGFSITTYDSNRALKAIE